RGHPVTLTSLPAAHPPRGCGPRPGDLPRTSVGDLHLNPRQPALGIGRRVSTLRVAPLSAAVPLTATTSPLAGLGFTAARSTGSVRPSGRTRVARSPAIAVMVPMAWAFG